MLVRLGYIWARSVTAADVDAALAAQRVDGRPAERYVMIVNKSLSHSWCCNPTFAIPPRKVHYVSPVTGDLKPFPAPYYWLAPGQGVLLKLEC